MNKKENLPISQQTYDIYVANVPKFINESEFKRLFLKYGEIKQVLCRWKDDYIGYGIVKFVYKDDADRLLNENDEVYLNGQIMPIKAARRLEPVSNIQTTQNETNTPPPIKQDKKRSQFIPPPVPPHPNPDFGYFHQMNYSGNVFNSPQPMMIDVLCTNVENAVTFYGFPANRTEELNHLTNALNTFAMTTWNTSRSKIEKRLYSQKVYAALFSEDKSWYRCIIVRSSILDKPGMCTVRYIDYGNQEDIFTKNIIELPDSLQKVPPFASKFYLNNLKCESQQETKQPNYLHQLVNKRMTLCAIASSSSREFQVIKCTCDGKDVIAEIVKKGLAKHTNQALPKSPKDNLTKPKAVHNGPDIVLKNKTSKTAMPVSNQNFSSNASSAIKSRRASKSKEKNGEIQCNGNSENIKEETEFHPKRIIKRGELADVIGIKETMNSVQNDCIQSMGFGTNERRQIPSISMMDNVIGNLKLINNIRSLVSQSTDDRVIGHAVQLLKSEIPEFEKSDEALKSIKISFEKYKLALNCIKESSKENLNIVKNTRDCNRNDLLCVLKVYLDNFNMDVLSRKELIQKAIMDLESNSNAWMNVQLEETPLSIDDLISGYNKVKEERWKLVNETRKQTNQKHKFVMDVFISLQEQFTLNTLDGNENSINVFSNASKVEKSVSYTDKLNSAISDLGKAVDEEIHMLTLTKDKNNISVIQCLLDRLDVQKEKVEALYDSYQRNFTMYEELSKVRPLDKLLTDLSACQKQIKTIAGHLNHFKMSNKDKAQEMLFSGISPIVKELHNTLIKEDILMERLAKDASLHLPEVNVEHPELGLSNYLENEFLCKKWKPDFFILSATEDQNIFLTAFLEEPAIIKRFFVASESERSAFVLKAVKWNQVKNDLTLKLKGVFYEGLTTFIMLPVVTKNLYNSPPLLTPLEAQQACQILRQVLSALKNIHVIGIAHESIHPVNILIKDEKILLNFSLNLKSQAIECCLKGINFQPPGSLQVDLKTGQANDMYQFGCLVLYVLFRNLSFTSVENAGPNLEAYRSIVEEVLGQKDYALLSSLISTHPEKRPTPETLISGGFLNKYENFCCSRSDRVTTT